MIEFSLLHFRTGVTTSLYQGYRDFIFLFCSSLVIFIMYSSSFFYTEQIFFFLAFLRHHVF